MTQNAETEHGAVSAAEAELARVRRSLARRDRRIAYLRKLLRESRAASASAIAEKSEIIAGLELALLWDAPVDDTPARERIARLEKLLAAMTTLADSLHQREAHTSP